jgi:hypothetical protein
MDLFGTKKLEKLVGQLQDKIVVLNTQIEILEIKNYILRNMFGIFPEGIDDYLKGLDEYYAIAENYIYDIFNNKQEEYFSIFPKYDDEKYIKKYRNVVSYDRENSSKSDVISYLSKYISNYNNPEIEIYKNSTISGLLKDFSKFAQEIPELVEKGKKYDEAMERSRKFQMNLSDMSKEILKYDLSLKTGRQGKYNIEKILTDLEDLYFIHINNMFKVFILYSNYVNKIDDNEENLKFLNKLWAHYSEGKKINFNINDLDLLRNGLKTIDQILTGNLENIVESREEID